MIGAATVMVLAAVLTPQGNELIVQETTLRTSSLAGVITDSTGAAIPGVEVQIISCSAMRTVDVKAAAMVRTSLDGHFDFESRRNKKAYCLQFRSPGFDLLRVAVTLDKHAQRLRVVLKPGV